MIIEEVVALGFGTLRGQHFKFRPGLNIVYGPNEAGKSTLQFLIYALLYGLKKEHFSTLREEAEHYRPWSRPEPFGGRMRFEALGRKYLVEREFTGKGTVKLYDALTGADLSPDFVLDKRGELLFAEELLGLSPTAFRKLTYFGQLESGQVGDLGAELAGKLANLASSGEEELSLSQALTAIGKAKEEIGTERLSSKPFSRLLQREAQLLALEQEAEAGLAELWRQQGELVALKDEIAACEEKQTKLLAQQKGIQAYLLAKRLARMEGFLAQEEVVKNELAALSEAVLPEGFQKRGESCHREGEWLEEELAKSEAKLVRLQQEQEEAARKLRAQEEARQKLVAAIGGAPPVVSQRLKEQAWQQKEERLELERELVKLEESKARGGWLWLLLSLTFFAVGLKTPLFFLPGVASLVLFILILLKEKALQKKKEGQKRQLWSQLKELEGQERELAAKLAELRSILGEEGILAWQREGEELALKQGNLERLEAELSILSAEAKKKEAALSAIDKEIQELWQRAGAASWEEFWQKAERAGRRRELLAQKKQLDELLATFGGQEPETLRKRLAGLGKAKAGTEEEVEQLSGELESIERKLAELRLQAGKLEAQLAKDPQNLGGLTEERIRVTAELEELRLQREALDYAETVLQEAAGELHREFAPQLNLKVSRVFQKLSLGKYQRVLVGEDLEPKVEGQEGLIPVTRLSGGAQDQLFFALRYALAGLVGREGVALPFLLDDSFVQYDENRAGEAWATLQELASVHQLIYFTCHREVLALCGEDAHVITLRAGGRLEE